MPFFRRLFSQNLVPKSDIKAFDFKNINLESYRDLDRPVKNNTTYAFLDVEPFPRFKIMELSLFILESLKIDIPADAICRIYLEEMVKYTMEIVHKTEDVRELEAILGFDDIELFLEEYSHNLTIIEAIRKEKMWINTPISDEDMLFFEKAKTPYADVERFMKFENKIQKPLMKWFVLIK